MSTYGAPSGLTEQEKSLACYLAVQSLAQNRGISEEEASDLLDEAAGRGEMRLVGDEQGWIYVIHVGAIGRTVLAAADRATLRRVAHPTGQTDN